MAYTLLNRQFIPTSYGKSTTELIASNAAKSAVSEVNKRKAAALSGAAAQTEQKAGISIKPTPLSANMKSDVKTIEMPTLGQRLFNVGKAGVTGSAASAVSTVATATEAIPESRYGREEQADVDLQNLRREREMYRGVLADSDPIVQRLDKAISELEESSAIYRDEEAFNERQAKNLAEVREKASTLKESSAKATEEAKKGLGTVGSFLVDTGVAGTQMLIDGAISAATGTGMAPMLVRSFGNGAQEGHEKGYSAAGQIANGVKSAAVEYLSEKLFGGNPIYDTDVGLVNRLAGMVAGNDSKLVKALASKPVEVLGEGLEEVLSGVLNPAIDYIATGEAEWSTVEELVRDGLVGIALGGAATGVQAGINKAAGAKTKNTAETSNPFIEVIERANAQKATDSTKATAQTAGTAAASNPLSEIVLKAVEEQQTRRSEPAQNPFIEVMEKANAPTKATAAEVVGRAMDNSRALESVGAASKGFDPVTEWQMGANETYAVNEAAAQDTLENRGRVAFDMPTTDINDQQISKHASTLINANITTNEMSSVLQEAARTGLFSYQRVTDEKAAENAKKQIEYDGWEAAYGAYKKDILAGRTSKDIVAMGTELYNNAVNAGNLLDAMDIASLMVQNSTNTAQAMQAMNMVNKASPEMQLYMKVKSIENIRDQILRRYGDKAPDIQIDDGLLNNYRDALVSGDKKAEKTAWKALAQDVANQLPSTFADKWNAWRYLSMLGNVRTHARNIEGNVVMTPIRMMKDVLATGMEAIGTAISGGKMGRTKAVVNVFSAKDRALFTEANKLFSEDKDAIQSGGKYDDAIGEIERMKTIFNFAPMEAAREANSLLLDVEDLAFSYPAYMTALTGYMKANGITAEAVQDGTVDEAALDKAREYAVNEAAKATFRDTNEFSKAMSKMNSLKNSNNKVIRAVGTLAEGVFPFKKTPANILSRGVEYSPVGLIRGAVNAVRAVKSEKVTAAQAIDQMASGLTGSALTALGFYLARMGTLMGGNDEDEKQQEFNELQGYQNYAINVDGKSYTIDNLAPAAMPLFLGVELQRLAAGEGIEPKDIFRAIARLGDPVVEMSLLSGVQDLIDSASYVDESGIGSMLSNVAMNYLSQGLPTIFGQIERTFLENEREQTYRYGESVMFDPTGQYTAGKIANKIPFVDYNQIPYIDAWGRRESNGTTFESFVQNFVNPHYVSEITTTAVDTELQRLYDAGMENVFPQRAAQSTKITVDGEQRYMTADEYVTYAETKGQTSYNLIKDFMESDLYKSMDDESRADVIAEIYSYATDKAKREVIGEGYESDWDKYVDKEDDIASIKAVRQALNLMTDSDYTDVEPFNAVYGWYKGLGASMKTELLESVDGLEKVVNCLDAGMTTQEYGAAKMYHDELNRNDSMKAAERATEFAYWLTQQGLTQREQTAAKANLTFSSGFTVGAEKYEEMTGSGLEPEVGRSIYDAVNQLTAEPGYSVVRDVQRYEAITGLANVSEADKLEAIKIYSDGEDSAAYRHYKAAFESGAELDAYTGVLRSIDKYHKILEKDGGSISQGELYLALYNAELTDKQRQAIWESYAGNWVNKSYAAARSKAVEVSAALYAAEKE